MEKQLNSSGNMFPGFTSLQILQVIQNDWQKRNTEPEKFTDRIIFIAMFNDIDWTRRGNDEVCISNSESQGTRAEILAWTLDVPRSWKWKEVVWKSKVSSWTKVGFSSVSDGTAIQGNSSPSLHKCQCIESWNSESADKKRNHTLQCGCSHHPFCKSAQYLRSSLELVWAIRFNNGREGTRKNSRKRRIREQRNSHEREFTRSELFWYLLQDLHLETVCGETFRTSDDCPRRFSSQGVAKTHRSGTEYRLRGRRFWRNHPIMRKYTFSSVNTHNPEHMQQFLKEQLLDQTLKFTSWKCLTILDLKLQFRLQRTQDGHPMFWFPKDRVDSWTNCISRISDMMSPVRSEHANAKESELCLATIDRRILLRRLLQVVRAPGNWMRTLSAFLPAQCACSQKEPFLRRKGSGKILLPINSSYGGSLSTAISKMVTRLVRHYDQEERQSDGAFHGGTIGRNWWKCSQSKEDEISQKKHWLRLIHEGSSKTRFEYCEDSKNCLACFPAIQGHSGGITTAPELMEHN